MTESGPAKIFNLRRQCKQFFNTHADGDIEVFLFDIQNINNMFQGNTVCSECRSFDFTNAALNGGNRTRISEIQIV